MVEEVGSKFGPGLKAFAHNTKKIGRFRSTRTEMEGDVPEYEKPGESDIFLLEESFRFVVLWVSFFLRYDGLLLVVSFWPVRRISFRSTGRVNP